VGTGRVSWDPRREVLDLEGVLPGTPAHLALGLAHGSRLVALCRERSRAAVLASCRITLRDGRTALVQARCAPGATEPTWVVIVSGNGAPVPEDEVAAAIRRLRTETGL
jgi:hypothetical protein